MSLLFNALLLPAILLAAPLLSFALFVTVRRIQSYRSPLNILRGPKSRSWFLGSTAGINDPHRLMEDWVAEYGDTLVVQGLFSTRRLLTVDTTALHHVFSNWQTFVRPEEMQRSFGALFGKGLLFAVGEQHRRQRRVINSAFGPMQVRAFTEVFVQKANELRDIWLDLASKTARKDGRVKLDAFSWLNKATLDIIGLTGFDHDFDALHAKATEASDLHKAFQATLTDPHAPVSSFLSILPIPSFLTQLGTSRRQRDAFQYIREAGHAIVQEKKVAVLAAADGRALEKSEFQNDLLSLLIKSNLASDLPASMRMSDEEISGQVPTFLVAGHETTSTAVTWTLFALACHAPIQAQLRAELLEFPTDTPTMDELNALPMLDHVLREALRLYAPVSMIDRSVTEDTVIPFGKPFVDKYGVTRTELHIRKGDSVIIPIRMLNRSVEIWGDDAQEFRPERWENLPESAHTLPSVYSNLLTFNAGPHACIGFRFSNAEAKALIFSIIRAFEVELAIQPDDIVRKTAIVGRPYIEGKLQGGVQLPLLVRPVCLA
ncbi:cytochrome P450 [Vararia minispora EC-137]|uniref:Cytochrome P450 n=1 Tax=Vararia minispora EC-137 TaxID=1314806 RepID=A0ACB8QAQ3_9AGAM|nr:cytochrome P450 [Vararia minispora EC-137]